MDNSLAQIQTLHPKLRDTALQAYNEAVKTTPVGVHPIITQGLRTFAESDKLYAQGRTTPGQIVTNAPAGSSYHNYGLAVDFALVINGKTIWDQNNPNWATVVNIFKKYGFTWGGDFAGSFKDYPHLEQKFGHNWKDLLVLYNAGTFIPGTTYVQI
jgi:peptidoglycan L-alanyl-D-glutamate endopeptidase CwlK